MNNIVRAAVRLSSFKTLTLPLTNKIGIQNAVLSRSLYHMSKTPTISKHLNSNCSGCSCGCGSRFAHTDGAKELVNFLHEEITSEKDVQKTVKLPTQLDGFEVKFDNAEVELKRQSANETILIKFNVNHTVDADETPAYENEERSEQSQENTNVDQLKSKPNFEVDIVRNGTTLSFTCSFLPGEPAEGDFDDLFGIQELTIYKGEYGGEKVYACSGDVLDGYLYDLLMTYLEEKGISNEFSSKLIALSTDYERSQYITFLESLKTFVSA